MVRLLVFPFTSTSFFLQNKCAMTWIQNGCAQRNFRPTNDVWSSPPKIPLVVHVKTKIRFHNLLNLHFLTFCEKYWSVDGQNMYMLLKSSPKACLNIWIKRSAWEHVRSWRHKRCMFLTYSPVHKEISKNSAIDTPEQHCVHRQQIHEHSFKFYFPLHSPFYFEFLCKFHRPLYCKSNSTHKAITSIRECFFHRNFNDFGRKSLWYVFVF